MNGEQQTCGACKHFHAVPNDLTQGRCFRYPPTAMPIPSSGGIATWSDWPVVKRVQSCGEYAPKFSMAS